MCFSATASFLASGSIGAIGAAGLKKVRRRRDYAIAAIPFFFAIQQALEGIVWLSLNRPFINLLAAKGYLFFAYAFWPIYIPWAVRLAEPQPKRKSFLLLLLSIGIAVGLYGLWLAILTTTHALVVNRGLQYHVPETYLAYGFFYVLAVSVSFFVSSSRWLVAMGVLLSAALAVAIIFSYETVASVWCFYAALLSSLTYLHLF
ncbi:hypothetical protein HY633_00660 [Candidatus Uhrbacteria bacterium]|nr:hypothetical protein [Candidatus Uhrbacteria bacterium]